MSTRSSIAIHTGGGLIAIYCHSDGYPAHVGKVLTEHYTVKFKVGELMALGNLSSLAAQIGEAHDFNDRSELSADWCRAYGRDRGEKEQGFKMYGSTAAWLADCAHSEIEYAYSFFNEQEGWTCFEINSGKIIELVA